MTLKQENKKWERAKRKKRREFAFRSYKLSGVHFLFYQWQNYLLQLYTIRNRMVLKLKIHCPIVKSLSESVIYQSSGTIEHFQQSQLLKGGFWFNDPYPYHLTRNKIEYPLKIQSNCQVTKIQCKSCTCVSKQVCCKCKNVVCC